jgi:hypothetical protein
MDIITEIKDELQLPIQIHNCNFNTPCIQFLSLNKNNQDCFGSTLSFEPKQTYVKLEEHDTSITYTNEQREDLEKTLDINFESLMFNELKGSIKRQIQLDFLTILDKVSNKNLDKLSRFNKILTWILRLFNFEYVKKTKIKNLDEFMRLTSKAFINLYTNKFLVGKQFVIIPPKFLFKLGLDSSQYFTRDPNVSTTCYNSIALFGKLNHVDIYINHLNDNIYCGVQQEDVHEGIYLIYSSKNKISTCLADDFINNILRVRLFYAFKEVGDDAYLNYKKLNIKMK